MTTVVNTPGSTSSDAGGSGMIIGVIVLLVVLFLIFFYGMPYLRGNATQESAPAPVIQVPDQIDVNVNEAP